MPTPRCSLRHNVASCYDHIRSIAFDSLTACLKEVQTGMAEGTGRVQRTLMWTPQKESYDWGACLR